MSKGYNKSMINIISKEVLFMMSISKLSPKFQVTIPSEIRDALGAKPGDRIIFQKKTNGEVVVRCIPFLSAKDLAGSLKRASGKEFPYIPIEVARRITYDDLAERFANEVRKDLDKESDDKGDSK
ncbi:AbrB/MazE/SpoVT family DNA-binding domain-containing protein [Alicyclobacillaceae bacterium I2511]|nr:AbrB/MazE/SpoVT family DNA-binding domain-containing protein [Alicyclobacillaceae bacterium I2511]